MVDKFKFKRFGVTALLVILILFVVPFSLNSQGLTGNTILGINIGKTYEFGDPLQGSLFIRLNTGEHLPKRAVVRLETTSNGFYEYSLSNIIGVETKVLETEGDHFIKDASFLSGNGPGYGVMGVGEKQPVDVVYDIVVYPEEKKEDYVDFTTEKKVDKVIGGGGSSKVIAVAENGGASEPIGGGDESDDEAAPDLSPPAGPGGAPTGLAIGGIGSEGGDLGSDEGSNIDVNNADSVSSGSSSGGSRSVTKTVSSVISTEIPGVISGEAETFTGNVNNHRSSIYIIEEKDKGAGVVSGSVEINGKKASDDEVDLKINNGVITVSTDYSEPGLGFGSAFLGDETIDIEISLDRFGEIPAKGTGLETIKASLILDGNVLAYAFEEFQVKGEEIEEIKDIGINIERTPSEVVVGEFVKWNAKVDLTHTTERIEISVPESEKDPEIIGVVRSKIPADLELVVVKLLEDAETTNLVEKERTKEEEDSEDVSAGITGGVTTDISLDKSTFDKAFDSVRGFFGFENNLEDVEEISKVEVGDSGELIEVVETEDGLIKKVEISYFTDAIESIEVETKNGKEIGIIPSERFVYKDVVAWTLISDQFNVRHGEMISVYSVSTGEYVKHVALDTDGTGFIDYVEWAVPILEKREDYIIEISSAQHLDSNRELINDIYLDVKEKDDKWSETIPAGDFVRVGFEQLLDFNKDITVYPRTISGNPRIEIYLADGNEVIARFNELVDNEYNKVLLTEMEGEHDLFDLLILDGDVEFDYIVDPSIFPIEIGFTDVTPRHRDAIPLVEGTIHVGLTTEGEENRRHYSFNDFNNDLVLWMRMDDVKLNGDLEDLSSYDSTGVLKGNVVIDKTLGYWGKSAMFDGGHISLLDEGDKFSNFDAGSEFTVTAWIKSGDNSKDMHIVSDMDRTGIGWALRYDSDGRVEFVVSDGSVSRRCYFEGFLGNKWTLVAGIFDKGNLNCGVDRNYKSGEASGESEFSNNVDVSIGSLNANSGALAWNGFIDEVLMFERALERNEIASLYNSATKQYYHGYGDFEGPRHVFKGYAVDAIGQISQTEEREVKGVLTCLKICDVVCSGICEEGSDCVLDKACVLRSEDCSGDECNFGDLTINNGMYTLIDNDGNGKNLRLVVDGDLMFGGDEGVVVFNGKSAQQGGNGGDLNLIVKGLFHTENAKFKGQGGYSHDVTKWGGDGGGINLDYRGKFGVYTPVEDLVGGDSGSGRGDKKGDDGEAKYDKNLDCSSGSIDADVSGDGLINTADLIEIDALYNVKEGDPNFNPELDVTCKGEIDISSLARIGFEWDTRN